jgi:hypothetical protein
MVSDRPSRTLPRIGDPVAIVHLGTREPGEIVTVDGASVEVATADGATLVFDLNPNTAHFVRRGDPYWGVRLQLRCGWGRDAAPPEGD